MNKVTKVTAAIAACAGMFAFTACGSSSAETGGDVELNIWGGVQADQGFNKVIEGFEEANPGIKVNYTRFTNDPTGNTKLDTALIADDSIDMFFTYTPADFAKRAGSGIPLDLSEVDEDDKVEDANIKYDGKYYGIPTSNESYNIVYNKTAFEKLGITIPANWTWDEFMEIARKATHEENGKTVYGLAGVWHNIERQIYGGDAEYTKDGESPNFSDKGWTIKQKYYDMLFKDKSAYPFTQIMAKKIYNYESQLLLTGDALMAFYSPWMSRSALNNAEQYPRDFKMGFAPPAQDRHSWRRQRRIQRRGEQLAADQLQVQAHQRGIQVHQVRPHRRRGRLHEDGQATHAGRPGLGRGHRQRRSLRPSGQTI